MLRKASALFDQFWPVLLPGFWAVLHAFQLLRFQFSGAAPAPLAALEGGQQRVAWMFVLEFIATVTLVWLQGRRQPGPDALKRATGVTSARRLGAGASVVVGRVLQLSTAFWVEGVACGLATRLWLAFGPLPEAIARAPARQLTNPSLPDVVMVASLLTGWIPVFAGRLLVAQGRRWVLPLMHKLLGLAALLILGGLAVYTGIVLIYRPSYSEIPTASGATCTVTEGDSEDQVRAKCGTPCGRGNLPESFACHPRPIWPSEMFDGCSPSCDVYSTAAVCYTKEGVVLVLKMRPPGESVIRTCNW